MPCESCLFNMWLWAAAAHRDPCGTPPGHWCAPSLVTPPDACGFRRSVFNDCQGRVMQSAIASCSCDGSAGGFGAYRDSTLLAMDSVRVPALECGSSPTPLPCAHPAPVTTCTDHPRLHSKIRWRRTQRVRCPARRLPHPAVPCDQSWWRTQCETGWFEDDSWNHLGMQRKVWWRRLRE